MSEYKIEITFKPEHNTQSPYYWNVLETGTMYGWHSISHGFADTALNAFLAANGYLQGIKAKDWEST